MATRRHLITSAAMLGATALSPRAFAAKKGKKLGVALVGLGQYSRDLLAPALQLTSHCELRGVVSGSPEKVVQWQKKYNLKDKNIYHYDNMYALADNPDIDVVYIVTPTYLHERYSVIAANAGKHVWCEKPMAMTMRECQNIMEACDKNKVKLSIGYRLQHEPNTRTVIGYAKSKPYGAIKSLIAEAGYAGNGSENPLHWRMDRTRGGGAIYDMGVYPINAARYATGLEPIAISAKHVTPRPEIFKRCDESTVFTLEFAGGITAQCETSVGKNINHLKVTAQKGWYELDPMQSYTGVKGRTSDGTLLNKTIANQQAQQMDDSAVAILEDAPVMVPGTEGLMDIRVVEGALESARHGGKRVVLS
ncbi:MAG TPA: Gfo/Idh/MocA family oxidoreductase [Marinagarivorans sp.]